MKKITMGLILCPIFVFSQCDFKAIYPFEIGNTKFDITNILSSSHNKLICVDTGTYNNGWTEFDYLEKQVYRTVINLKNNESCLESTDNHIQLYLANDYLYRTNIKIEFSDSQYALMLEKYREIQNLIPDNYKYSSKFAITNSLEEKVGEGIDFYTVPKEKRSKTKTNNISVGYSINYEKIFDKDTQVYKTTAKVKSYTIVVDIVDLRGTTLTNKGF